MSAFDSPKRFQEYMAGAFPKIHDDIYNAVVTEALGTRFCDLCCSTGLLGERLTRAGLTGFGVEVDHKTVDKAKQSGVALPIHIMRISHETYPDLEELLREYKTDVLVARRCLSEIFATERKHAPDFATMLRRAGIGEVFLQGRQPVPNATHPIPTVREEVECLQPYWKPAWVQGQLAYLLPCGI